MALAICACSNTDSDVSYTTSQTDESQSSKAEESTKSRSEILNTEPDMTALENEIALPDDSSQYSNELAEQALLLCTGHTQDKEADIMENAGFSVIAQVNFDKDDSSPEHTAAYTVAAKDINYKNEVRTLVVVAIRGTNAGEWYSNFDFAESHSDDTSFAENFLFAAEDIMLGLENAIAQISNPLILICGHSRGGACANLLGMLENSVRSNENIFTYTFASPATYKDEEDPAYTDNIFNVINPCDIVPTLPLASWGFRRLGNDMVLNADQEKIDDLNKRIETLDEITKSVSSYYNDRHSLTKAGLSEDGMTTFEVFMVLASYLAETGTEDSGNESEIDDLDLSDMLSAVSESDFYPLFDMLDSLTENDGAEALEYLENHMPYTYQNLLREN